MIIFKKYILPSFSFSPSNSKPIYSLGVCIYIIMCSRICWKWIKTHNLLYKKKKGYEKVTIATTEKLKSWFQLFWKKKSIQPRLYIITIMFTFSFVILTTFILPWTIKEIILSLNKMIHITFLQSLKVYLLVFQYE